MAYNMAAVTSTQMAATISNNGLPNGWRRVLASDGRPYYQNDITKQTQWHKPTLTHIVYVNSPPSTIHSPPPTVQPQAPTQKSETLVPKLCEKRNIIFVVTCILAVWDVYTDWYAGIAWMNLNYKQCETDFKCVYAPGSMASPMGYLFITFAILGFLSTCIGKYIAFKELRYIYEHCKTEEEVQRHEAKTFKHSLKWDMITFLIEDTTAIVMVTIGALFFGDNDNTISQAMLQSAITSVFVMIGVWIKTAHNKRKFNAFLEMSDKMCYYGCWCCCFCIVIGLGIFSLAIIGVTSRKSFSEPFVSLNIDTKEECHLAYPDEDDYFVDGEVLRFPQYLFPNCSGDQYAYGVACKLTGVKHEYIDDNLKCELSFAYNVDDSSSLYAVECDNTNYDNDSMSSYCNFDIPIGTCEMYTIECSDNAFHIGNATMFACFDYCSFQ